MNGTERQFEACLARVLCTRPVDVTDCERMKKPRPKQGCSSNSNVFVGEAEARLGVSTSLLSSFLCPILPSRSLLMTTPLKVHMPLTFLPRSCFSRTRAVMTVGRCRVRLLISGGSGVGLDVQIREKGLSSPGWWSRVGWGWGSAISQGGIEGFTKWSEWYRYRRSRGPWSWNFSNHVYC